MQAQIEQQLKTAIGLEPASIGTSTVEFSVRSRMRACGITRPEEYVDRLLSSPDELQQLIEEIVVPETWFFRDPETFKSLAAWVTNWRSTAASTEILRVLSFGCCTGEEPYSIAMCLLDSGVEADRFTIDGADISARALARARNGAYGQNSFRTDDLGFRDQYFVKTSAGYRPADLLRKQVRFFEGNLLDSRFPTDERIYHVIFCRNVLIYFDQSAQEQAVGKLQSLLHANGILFAGPAESYLMLQRGFAASSRPRGFVRERRKIDPAPRHIPERRQTTPPSPKLSFTSPPPVHSLNSRVRADLRYAEELANSGKLGEAAEVCRTYLLENGPTAEAYYLLGLVLDAMDRKTEAADNYRKALYLRPEHVDALTQLALLAENMGDDALADRLRQRLRRAESRAKK